MPAANALVCPDCGVEMNCHAEKLDLTAVLDESDAVDPELGGILEEVHTCPRCGKTVARRAAYSGLHLSEKT
jgi:predicted RNA-binding Zn-ribbon protein involved in translation (DUF1610 family)